MIKELLSSKKAISWIATVLVLVGNKLVGHFGYELDSTTVEGLVAVNMAYLVGQGIADHGSTAAGIVAKAAP